MSKIISRDVYNSAGQIISLNQPTIFDCIESRVIYSKKRFKYNNKKFTPKKKVEAEKIKIINKAENNNEDEVNIIVFPESLTKIKLMEDWQNLELEKDKALDKDIEFDKEWIILNNSLSEAPLNKEMDNIPLNGESWILVDNFEGEGH